MVADPPHLTANSRLLPLLLQCLALCLLRRRLPNRPSPCEAERWWAPKGGRCFCCVSRDAVGILVQGSSSAAGHTQRAQQETCASASQLKHSKKMAPQLYCSRKKHEVYLLHGEAVVTGDLGPKRVPSGKTFLYPDKKGNPVHSADRCWAYAPPLVLP